MLFPIQLWQAVIFVCWLKMFALCYKSAPNRTKQNRMKSEPSGTWINLLGKLFFAFIPHLQNMANFVCVTYTVCTTVHPIWLNHSSKSSSCNCKWLQRKLSHCTMIRIVFWWIFISDATKWMWFFSLSLSLSLSSARCMPWRATIVNDFA